MLKSQPHTLTRDFSRDPISQESDRIVKNLQERFGYYCTILIFMLENWSGIKDKNKIKEIVESYRNKVDLGTLLTKKDLQEKLYSILEIARRFTGEGIKVLSKHLQLADSLYSWNTGTFHPVVTISTSSDGKYTYQQTDTPHYGSLTEAQVREILNIYSEPQPKWFLEHPPFARKFLYSKFFEFKGKGITPDLVKSFGEKFNNIPSNWRRIPGLANNLHHTFEVYDKASGERILSFETNSSSTPPPINVKDQETAVRLTRQNIEQYAALAKGKGAKHPWVQCLLSSTRFIDPIIGMINGDNSAQFVAILEKALGEENANGMEVGYSIHPLNPLKDLRLLPIDKATVNLNAAVQLFAFLKERIDEFYIADSSLVPLITPANFIVTPNDFKQKLTSGSRLSLILGDCDKVIDFFSKQLLVPGLKEDRKQYLWEGLLLFSCVKQYIAINADQKYKDVSADKNLFCGALELIMLDKMGSAGSASCKSGKDRAGLMRLWADAILAYFVKYKKIPEFTDAALHPNDRKNFINIFVDLFKSNHYGALAGQNSPFAEGLKSVSGILPKDVLHAISEDSSDTLSLHAILSSINTLSPKKNDADLQIIDRIFLESAQDSQESIDANKNKGENTADIVAGLGGTKDLEDSSINTSQTAMKINSDVDSVKNLSSANSSNAVKAVVGGKPKTIEISHESTRKYPQLYILTGDLSVINKALTIVAKNEGILVKMSKDSAFSIYNLFKGSNKLSEDERISFLSKVCIELKQKQQEILFDSGKQNELMKLRNSFENQVQLRQATYSM